MMGKRLDIRPGERFGRLTIIKEVECRNWVRRFLCRCDCGVERIVRLGALRNRSVVSCGCYMRENNSRVMSERNKTHGLSKTRLYRIWCGMKSRCYNSNDTTYKNYGGREIEICDEWLGENGFITFYNWAMQNGYADNLTIERNNHEGNYEPDNCRWIPIEDQAKNTRRIRLVRIGNDVKSLSEWCRVLNVSMSTVYKRLNKGWSAEKALTHPIKTKIDGRY